MKKFLYIFIVFFTSRVLGETYTSNVPNACETKMFYAIIEHEKYTCANGYFLPANTTGCQPCPDGYTCNGGTFSFNEHQSQGIIYTDLLTSNASNICALNFSHRLFAVFEPIASTTINLSYDYGNGTTTNGTCIYGEIIELPETPKRPGYNFIGWKLKENN